MTEKEILRDLVDEINNCTANASNPDNHSHTLKQTVSTMMPLHGQPLSYSNQEL